MNEEIRSGLGNKPEDEWPSVTARELDMRPIDRLKPGSVLHGRVLGYLLQRLTFSERKMSSFYARWGMSESRVQAYVDLPDYELKLRLQNEAKEPPKVVSIVVPYSYATISTICTYHLQTFCGRKPIWQVSANKQEAVQPARNMETVLQYNSDHNRIVSKLWQFLWDGQVYGVSILRTAWKNDRAMRTVWKPRQAFLGMFGGGGMTKTREERLVYSGNDICNIDPYMFFPDPRVPMIDVNKKGEFVFWRTFLGKHDAKILESHGTVKWVNNVGRLPRSQNAGGTSERHLLSLGTTGSQTDLFSQSSLESANVQDFIQWDQGSVWIIPKELGLGDATVPQMWLFTIANKNQIVQAENISFDHGMHPVAVSEPTSLGYGFGQPGIADYIGPLQDTMSWYVNSHIHNVRTALNNMFVYDPSRIEKQDLLKPGAGKLIRVKPAGYGQNIQEMLQQLNVSDVTAQHTKDFELFMRLADSLTGVNDNVRGLQDSGGRKTATEVRTSGEAAASRLAAQSRVISAQGLVDLAEQMCCNVQQYQEEELYLAIVGQEGITSPLQILPEHLVGDFQFPVNDGSLPIDRVAMLDVWKEIFLAINQDPVLGARYDKTKIFEFIAELGGAKNLGTFTMPQVQGQVLPPQGEPGKNAVPIPFGRQGTPPTGINANPGQRAAG